MDTPKPANSKIVDFKEYRKRPEQRVKRLNRIADKVGRDKFNDFARTMLDESDDKTAHE